MLMHIRKTLLAWQVYIVHESVGNFNIPSWWKYEQLQSLLAVAVTSTIPLDIKDISFTRFPWIGSISNKCLSKIRMKTITVGRNLHAIWA